MATSHLNRPELARQLVSAAESFIERLAHGSDQLIANHGRAIAEAIALHEAGAELVEGLSAVKPFSGGAGFIVVNMNGYPAFNAKDAAAALIKRVHAGSGPEDALNWLTILLETPCASGRAITALWGLECEQPLELHPDIHLLPVGSLEDSSNMDRILQRTKLDDSGLGTPGFWRSPRVVLVTPATIKPLLHSGTPPQQEDPFRFSNLLDDTRLALSLCGPSYPLSAGHWFELDDKALRDLFGCGSLTLQHIEVLPLWMDEPHRLDPDKARRVVSGFLGMQTDLRAIMRLSLSRFSQALRRPSHGDRALDLTIALESLLVDNAGENTYKFSLRAALLLGGSVEERCITRALFSALYGLRSTLVHDGVLPQSVKVAGSGKRPSVDVVNEATIKAALLLERIIELGRIPDWYRIELGQPLDPQRSDP